MDFLIQYGPILWFILALLCLVPGIFLTLKPRHPRPLEIRRHSASFKHPPLPSASQLVCSNCHNGTDDPYACFCGFCGNTLVKISSKKAQRKTETIVVDERETRKEIKSSLKRRQYAEK